MTLIKICGLRTIEHIRSASLAGADMIGFVFAPSRRQITLEHACDLASQLRAEIAHPPRLVGLFVNAPSEEIQAITHACALDALQLSGDEPIEVLSQLPPLPILKSVRLNNAAAERDWLASMPEQVTLLVDAHVPGSYGGTGTQTDWQRAAELARQRPIMLAGGLTPENVAAAITTVAPWGVDVSTGVETDGQKDSAKIVRFIAAARATQAGARS